MSIRDNFPYSNFHELNLDWIIRYMKSVLNELETFEALNKITWAGVHDPSKEYQAWNIVSDASSNGYISIKAVPAGAILTNTNYWMPVANYSALYAAFESRIEALESANTTQADIIEMLENNSIRVNIDNYEGTFTEKIAAALADSKLIYIPSGTYNFDDIGKVSINTNADILCADDAVFMRATGTDWMFDFQSCSVTWQGGRFRSGISGSSTMMYDMLEEGYNGGAMRLLNCTDCNISGIISDYSNLPAVLVIDGCTNVKVHDCRFYYSVLFAVHILNTCINTMVADCYFDTVYIPNNTGGDVAYCYAVATGCKYLAAPTWMPPDILVYTRNVVLNSEDSGLDTHGATNVEISNNIITNCNTCITAYNDSNRVNRPAGWVMTNVVITNNVCRSSYQNTAGLHPYLIVASENDNRDSFNYIISNNVFETVNDITLYGHSIIDIRNISNVQVINNVFDGKGQLHTGIRLAGTEATLTGNVFRNVTNQAVLVSWSAKVYASNNQYDNTENGMVQTSTYYCYVKNDDIHLNNNTKMLDNFDMAESSGSVHIAVSTGICENDTFTNNSFSCTLTGDDLVSDNYLYLVPGQKINIGAYTGRVLAPVSIKHWKVDTSAPDGSYTVTGAAATTLTVSAQL